MKGLVLHVSSLQADWAVLGGFRRALLDLRASGKQVVAYLATGGGDKELYLASAADHVSLSPAGWLTLGGIASHQFYLRGLLDALGVQVQANAQGDYKTAAESLTSTTMSAPQKEQLQAIVDGRQALLSAALAEKVGAADKATELFTKVALGPEQACECGLAQSVAYEERLPVVLGETVKDSRWALSEGAFRAQRHRPTWRPLRTPPYLGIVALRGAIRQGGSWSSTGIHLRSTVALLRAARADKTLAGVVLYVDSPGGSALVSDLIHHEVERLAATKPVVAFFGAVAASGGYYIAAPCKRIVATPETLTGSIGVVSVRPVIAELLRRLHVHPQTIKGAPHADMMALSRAMTAEELEILDKESKVIYERFLAVVASGRRMERDEVVPLAGGRVWTAGAALERRLIDSLGDLPTAVDVLRELVGGTRELRAKLYNPRLPARPGVEGLDPTELSERLLAHLLPHVPGWDWLLASQERVALFCPWAQM